MCCTGCSRAAVLNGQVVLSPVSSSSITLRWFCRTAPKQKHTFTQTQIRLGWKESNKNKTICITERELLMERKWEENQPGL